MSGPFYSHGAIFACGMFQSLSLSVGPKQGRLRHLTSSQTQEFRIAKWCGSTINVCLNTKVWGIQSGWWSTLLNVTRFHMYYLNREQSKWVTTLDPNFHCSRLAKMDETMNVSLKYRENSRNSPPRTRISGFSPGVFRNSKNDPTHIVSNSQLRNRGQNHFIIQFNCWLLARASSRTEALCKSLQAKQRRG